MRFTLIPHPGQTPSPRSIGIPHDSWRPSQWELVEWLLQLPRGSVSAFELATGLGKTAVASALGAYWRTIGVVALKSLQDQYVDYGFKKIMGRSNYPCTHPSPMFKDATAEDCMYESMRECDYYCPYQRERDEALEAERVIHNYHYYSLVGRMGWWDEDEDRFKRMWEKDYLVLDEAHELPTVTISHYSMEINAETCERYDLPKLLNIPSTMPIKACVTLIMPWLKESISVMSSNINEIEDQMKNVSKSKLKRLSGTLRRMERVQNKMALVKRSLEENPEDWYISSDWKGVIARPLTAKHTFKKLFAFDDARVVTMSATIGDFDDFFTELGIENGHSNVIPSRFTPEQRPVYVYKNCPPMSKTYTDNHPEAWDKQADIIAEIIKECPSDWSGLIHVTRKKEAWLLKQRLDKRGLGARTWAMPGHDGNYVPTGEQVEAWKGRLRKVPNSILLSWCNWAGYDGKDERICIVAKVPYPVWGQPGSYEAAWRAYSMDRYRWTAANTIAQGVGRTRRGNDGDYDLNGKRAGMVAVVDGSFDGRVTNKMSQGIVESLVEV